MKKPLLFLMIFAAQLVSAQYEITVKAFILDHKTGNPVPYVNIGFIDKGIGTVSDESGAFTLVYDEDVIGIRDILQISAIGYETIKVSSNQLVRLLTNTNKIFIKPKPEVLEEVFITNEKLKTVYLGNPEMDRSAMGYWKDKNALGGEIATVLDIKKKNTKLKKLSFTVVENRSDSLKVRINLYDYKQGLPGQKLVNTNIFHTVSSGDSLVTIDLEKHNISLDRDCVIGIELLQVYGDIIEFAISGKKGRGISFKRYVSQDKWSRNSKIGMNFGIEAGIPVKAGEEVINQRDKPERITIYWNNSTLDEGRNLSKEISFLKSYLNALENVQVELILFNVSLSEPKMFTIRDADSDNLIDYLKEISYIGASSYADVLRENNFNADAALLFANGKSILSPLDPAVYIPLFTVNSSSEADHYSLQQAANYASGHYLNLNRVSVKEAVGLALNEIEDNDFYNSTDRESRLVYGKVFTVSGPIQGATVRLKGSFIETESDVDGFFEIEAEAEDILTASFMGMKSREVLVLNPESVPILLKPEGELLDEVELIGGRPKEEVIETGSGSRDSRSLGFSADMITSEDIGPQYNNLADVIRGRFPGVDVAGLNVAYNTPRFIIRGGGGSLNIAFAMFDIDGILYGSDQAIPPVDPQNIESITVLRSIVATNRYGQMGRGGAIVIRTKTLSGPDGETFESALVKGNDYLEEGIPILNESEKEKPAYLKLLEKANSFEEAKLFFNRLRQMESNKTVPFFLDSSEYFRRWDPDFSYSVLSSIASIAESNPKALKTLAFKLEELGKVSDALFIYERLVELRPKHEQSYRDLARIYAENNRFSDAMDLYKLMLANAIEGVEFVGLQRTIENELMHLLAFHRSKLDYSDLPNDLRTADFKYDLRLVFDWNDPNAEFELQFVNPQKKFFNWSHTRFLSEDRMRDEITYGYNTEEFIIDDAYPGEWIINVRYLRDDPETNPTYLKYTAYQKYGLPEETRTIKVIKLYEHQTKVTLDVFRLD